MLSVSRSSLLVGRGRGTWLTARVLVHGPERRGIIASSPELQERDRTKIADVSAAIGRALARGGVARTDAQLLGAIYADALPIRIRQTLTDDQKHDFGTHLGQAVGVITTFFHARCRPIRGSRAS